MHVVAGNAADKLLRHPKQLFCNRARVWAAWTVVVVVVVAAAVAVVVAPGWCPGRKYSAAPRSSVASP